MADDDAVTPVDLDALLGGDPADGAPVGAELESPVRVVAVRRWRIEDSPLHDRTRLQGRIVTDPREVAEIGRSIAEGKRRSARVRSWLAGWVSRGGGARRSW